MTHKLVFQALGSETDICRELDKHGVDSDEFKAAVRRRIAKRFYVELQMLASHTRNARKKFDVILSSKMV